VTDEPLKHALRLAHKLKKTAAEYRGGYCESVRFGKTGDTTYEVDEPIEEAVTDYFTDLKLPCRVMTEDSGVREFGKDPKHIFLIDPLDGSRNMRRGLPLYCASIAVFGIGAKELSDAKFGVIERFDGKEEYVAVKGKGATCNGKPIRSSRKTSLEDAIISMGCHFTPTIPLFADAGRRLGALTSCDERSIMVKCYGSTALELAYLAAGKTDFIYDLRAGTGFRLGLKTYDVAAGILLAREAGAKMIYGSRRMPQELPVDPYIPVQIAGAGNGRLFKALMNTLR
jgi:myo-inositol-1(or 4)-monophosphatase